VSIAAGRAQLSPNQLAKQAAIVAAAQQVLSTHGVAGCTAREVAAVGPLTKSGIHYYFTDMDALIDRAMAEHVAEFVTGLRAAGEGVSPPAAAFWTTVDWYLTRFREQPGQARLWFEYWAAATANGRSEVVAQRHVQVAAVLVDRLRAARVDAPKRAARAALVYLLGAVVEQSLVDQSSAARREEATRAHVAALVGLKAPRVNR
jgi:DNA-binding transcriptional regulator YbjK